MISAGELTERVVIQQPTDTQNAVGEATLAWSTFATVWAAVRATSGREVERYGQVVGISGHMVTIRALPGITTGMRVIYRNRTLEIGAINEFDRVWYMELICSETQAA
jgi:SPP1 family predicted phage head-tail adaptor